MTESGWGALSDSDLVGLIGSICTECTTRSDVVLRALIRAGHDANRVRHRRWIEQAVESCLADLSAGVSLKACLEDWSTLKGTHHDFLDTLHASDRWTGIDEYCGGDFAAMLARAADYAVRAELEDLLPEGP